MKKMKKRITFLTGAGVSRDSGIPTFRDGKDALWNNVSVNEVATRDGWEKDIFKAFKFYDDMKEKLPSYEPNAMHKKISKLEDTYEVTVVTQNIDDLHERAGSSNVIHLHGELLKKRTTGNPDIFFDNPIGEELKPGVTGDDGFFMRPHVVLFGEQPFNIIRARSAFIETDLIIIIGTSFSIEYLLSLVFGGHIQPIKILYIDPKPAELQKFNIPNVDITYIKKTAIESLNGLDDFLKINLEK